MVQNYLLLSIHGMVVVCTVANTLVAFGQTFGWWICRHIAPIL